MEAAVGACPQETTAEKKKSLVLSGGMSSRKAAGVLRAQGSAGAMVLEPWSDKEGGPQMQPRSLNASTQAQFQMTAGSINTRKEITSRLSF